MLDVGVIRAWVKVLSRSETEVTTNESADVTHKLYLHLKKS